MRSNKKSYIFCFLHVIFLWQELLNDAVEGGNVEEGLQLALKRFIAEGTQVLRQIWINLVRYLDRPTSSESVSRFLWASLNALAGSKSWLLSRTFG